MGLEITVIFSKSDAPKSLTALEQVLKPSEHVITLLDPLEPPKQGDVNIHLSVPVYGHMPWAGFNIFIKGSTYTKEWDPYMAKFDMILDGVPVNLLEKLEAVSSQPQTLPPVLEDLPRISIVTLIYNRPAFFDLACHNLMISDYPKDKIEWIIVDDSDKDSNAEKIQAVINRSFAMKMIYVKLDKRHSVAEKRNIGVEKASADLVLMMDDDDHYPETSIRRRVAWLKHSWAPRCVCATTIACYDLVKGISAVNTPPLDLSLGKRVSEATLTFYKSWWAERPFSEEIQVGEGEGFIGGREQDVLEIPPQQIIVAFSHGTNVSSRRIPSESDVKPGCFWGFPKEFLVFIHGLAGIQVKCE
jgi:hypothetical protein